MKFEGHDMLALLQACTPTTSRLCPQATKRKIRRSPRATNTAQVTASSPWIHSGSLMREFRELCSFMTCQPSRCVLEHSAVRAISHLCHTYDVSVRYCSVHFLQTCWHIYFRTIVFVLFLWLPACIEFFAPLWHVAGSKKHHQTWDKYMCADPRCLQCRWMWWRRGHRFCIS